MGLSRKCFGLMMICVVPLFFDGCATASNESKVLYEQGYRRGVKEQMQLIAAKFQGGEFPYYHWAAPMVQDVRVPAHIEQGVFIPEHQELVIIKPGEWLKNQAYPIATQENQSHEQNINTDVADITFMPARAR